MAKDDILGQITDKISRGLNRSVNEEFTKTLVRFFHQDGSLSGFLARCAALGFPRDNELAKEIYGEINGNIEKLTLLLKNQGEIAPRTGIPKRQVNLPKKTPKQISLSLNDEEEDDEDDILKKEIKTETNFKKRSINTQAKSLLLFDDEDELLDIPKASGAKKPFKFKKLKKEDAIRIKQEYEELDVIKVEKADPVIKKETAVKEELITLDKLVELEKLQNFNQDIQKDPDFLKAELADENENDRELDREWYTSEEIGAGTAITSQYEDIEDEVFTPKRQLSTPGTHKRSSHNKTGGGFDKYGQYVDYDHEESNQLGDISRLQIQSHFFVPPFLMDSKDSLILQLDPNSSKELIARKIGNSVDVVRDPKSELAISAKEGSFVVKEKKSKKERAKQAKDRSSLQGTAMGNVLGVENEEKKEHKEEEKVVEPEEQEESAEQKRLNIQQQRRSLPAFAVKNDLMRAISENQVTIVIGETGSGKTTQLTQFLYDEGYGANLSQSKVKRMIACTQPRRVAAMSVAKRVSEEMNCKLGEEVGYSIRFEDKTSSDKTIIKYMTEGILLREFLVDQNLDNYSCIIMDEAHERSLVTDVLLGLFRVLLKRRKDLKLIVTSATMNADRFTNFFGGAPQFVIPGRTFPVDVMFSKISCTDYVEAAVKQVLTIHLQNSGQLRKNDGDILVFMTGQEDIEITCELIQEKLDLLDDPPPLDILPIYSTLPADLQKKIFSKKSDIRRKVVVATNIAETSLTVDGIKYVVDPGLVKMKVFNPKLGMETLQVVPVSLANAQQRSGRAGRTGPGVAFRLYTERATKPEQMYMQPIPEIQRTNLSNVMLLLKTLKVEDITLFPFLDPPPKELLSSSLYELWSLGALDNLGDLTKLGHDLSRFPLEPTLSKLIILACNSKFHCSEEIIIIVSMLSIPSVFYRPKERAQEADAAREKFLITESDHLTLLNVYTQWEQQLKKPNMNYHKLSIWCNRNFVQNKSLLRARDVKNQIHLIMKQSHLPILKSKSDDDIRKCLCAALFHQLAKLIKSNISGTSQAEYVNLRHNYMKMYLHPTSGLNGGTDMAPPYVIYHELVLTTKEYMNYVTAVDPLWLVEFGYVFYGLTAEAQKKIEDKIDFHIIDKKELEAGIEYDKLKYEEKMSSTRTTKLAKVAELASQVKQKFNRRAY